MNRPHDADAQAVALADVRREHDSMGEIDVPAHALYGAQTQRAINNFPVSGNPLPEAFIRALLQIKRSAALANTELSALDRKTGEAIVTACEDLLAGNALMEHFPVDVFQTGSGTSTNMNANEVIAHVASVALGRAVGANDDVNHGQSSNDTIPTAIHVSAADCLVHKLLPALDHLENTIRARADDIGHVCKTGRTHLMDALPVTFGQVLGGWAAQLQRDRRDLESLLPDLQSLAQGGTAVGTGVNAHPDFAPIFNRHLSSALNLAFTPSTDYFASIGSQDTAVALSGRLKTTSVTLMKIANDLRWMNSGPLAGLGEITLPALQPGSSIMPGKVNPVIPEAVAMVAAEVIGNDMTITVAAQSGQFELNVMLPLIATKLLDSLSHLAAVVPLLADRAIANFSINESRLIRDLDRNPILVTALNPIIGHDAAAVIANEAYRSGRAIIDVAVEHTDLPRDRLLDLLDPNRLTSPHAR